MVKRATPNCSPDENDPPCEPEPTPTPVRTIQKKGNRKANPFILFFLATWRKEGGNYMLKAKECGVRWRKLSDKEKLKYKKQYCSKCIGCRSCKPKNYKKGGGGSGGGRKGGKC